jgi:hypothetical protein
MTKLFHHVAVEPEIKGAFEKVRAETVKLFREGSKFEGLTKTYFKHEDGGDELPPEKKERATTVAERLHWTWRSITDLLDYELTRDKANQTASADLEVDGVKLAAAVPVSTLLTLENRLKAVREIYDAIPTLDVARKWEKSDEGANVWQHGPMKQYRTAKRSRALVLHPATKEHPAQTKEVTDDVQIGHFDTLFFSGAVKPLEKATRLTAIDKLIVAVKRARMRANESEAPSQKIGEAIFKYIHEAPDVL